MAKLWFLKKPLLVLLTVLFLVPLFIDRDINEVLPYDGKEMYDPSLNYLNTESKLEQYIDSIAAARQIKPGTYEYASLIETALKLRFYHSFSHYSLQDNWIAALAGKLIKVDFACKVRPKNILKHPYAACSQQALVMMSLLRQKKMDYRNVNFAHHYAIEVKADSTWYFFDPNMEPNMTREQRDETHWCNNADSLKQYYDTARFHQLDVTFGHHLKGIHGPINQIPAPNQRLFSTVTRFFSKTLWCFPLLLLIFNSRISGYFRKKRAEKTLNG